MPDALSEKDRARLLQLLGIAGGSDHEGEALAAFRFAHKLLKQNKSSLAELLATNRQQTLADIAVQVQAAYDRGRAVGRSEMASEVMAQPRVVSWQDLADQCLEECHLLSEWERSFCEGFMRQRSRAYPSDKQRAVLERLAAKCGVPLPNGVG